MDKELEQIIENVKAGLEANSDANIRRFCLEAAIHTPIYTSDGNKGFDGNDAVVATAQTYYNFITGKDVK